MEKSNLSKYSFTTKAYGSILSLISVAIVCFSVFEIISYSLTKWLVLGTAGVICIILSQYNFQIPRTAGRVSPRELVIFWAIVWLGAGGGVLLAAFSVLGNFRNGIKEKVRWLMDASAITISTFISSHVFYSTLSFEFGFNKNPIANNPINAFWLLSGLIFVGISHFIVYSLLSGSVQKLEKTSEIHSGWKYRYFWSAVNSFSCVVGVFAFHLIIVYFGLSVGLLILPTTVIAHLAYRFHRKMLTQKTKEISEASRIHVATVEALATAIDARDQVGRGHVTRTQIFAVGIGKALNLPIEELNALNTGALLHDIGKLAVPDHILNKRGKLTPAETEKMKIHPEVGASILERVSFPYPVIPTVLSHHEAWDGSGYPDGLSKEKIPLTARILAIADAYDTIRGARPYRNSVSPENAKRHILESAGSQFDPRIVDIFIRNLEKFEQKIRSKDDAYRLDENTVPKIGEGTGNNNDLGYVEQIKRANREVFTLYELARVFSASLSLEETLSLFVKKIGELVPLDTCIVYLLDETRNIAVAAYAGGKNSESLKNRKIKIGQGATGYTLQKRQPIFNINPGLDFSFYQMEFIQEYTSMASLPLIANEKLLGAVSLYSCELESYEDEHMRLLESLSRIASDAISTSLRHAESETRALTDPMTSLPNARSLQLQFEKEIARARRNGSSFQILMLDLDGFKSINDNFGHKAGDKLLKDIAVVMGRQLRDYDFLSRYAGDEFVAIIPETTDEAVVELCQRMEKAVSEYKLAVGKDGFASVGVSLGAAAYPNDGDTLDQIIIAADKAMYEVKGRRKAKLKREMNAKLAEANAPIRIYESDVQEIDVEPIEAVEVVEVEKESLIVELDESHVVHGKSTKDKDRPL